MKRRNNKLSHDSYQQLAYLGVRPSEYEALASEVLERPGEVRIERTADPEYPWRLIPLAGGEPVKLCSLIEAIRWIEKTRAARMATDTL